MFGGDCFMVTRKLLLVLKSNASLNSKLATAFYRSDERYVVCTWFKLREKVKALGDNGLVAESADDSCFFFFHGSLCMLTLSLTLSSLSDVGDC